MDPEDLPDLGELDDIDLGGPDPSDEPAPLVPPVEPEPTTPDPTAPDPIDLGDLDLPDLPDLPDRDWGGGPQGPSPGDPPAGPPEDPGRVDPAAPGPAIELDLDDSVFDAPSPHGATAEQPGPGEAPAEVDLSLDPDGGTLLVPEGDEPGDADASDSADLPEPIELPSDLDMGPYAVADANSWLTPGLVAAGVVALGLSASAFRRRERAAPVDFAAQLDELGIDARVEHLDLTGLEELLAQDRSVLLSTDGTAGVDVGAVVALRSVDREGERVVVSDDRGSTFSVELDTFEAAWADSANQVVVAADGVERGVALVPVTLLGEDLVATS
jgi:hypothetical protein